MKPHHQVNSKLKQEEKRHFFHCKDAFTFFQLLTNALHFTSHMKKRESITHTTTGTSISIRISFLIPVSLNYDWDLRVIQKYVRRQRRWSWYDPTLSPHLSHFCILYAEITTMIGPARNLREMNFFNGWRNKFYSERGRRI